MYTLVLLLFLFLAILVLFIISSSFLGFIITRVPFVPSYAHEVKFIVEKFGITSQDTFYDLGSGDGRVIFLVEKLSGAKTKGFELTLWAFFFSKMKKFIKGSKAEFVNKNFFKQSWSEANFIYAYLYPPVMSRVEEKFVSNCKPGSYAIVRDFPFPSLKPINIFKMPKGHMLYIYKV